MDYKDTLNLPRTKFPMKANLPQAEPRMLARWQEMDLYARLRQAAQGRTPYILHDGPPYANGHIHMGTAFNKVLKDFIVKSRQMMGFDANYVPGWDCHGLPIEHNVDQKLGSKKLAMSQLEIRRACRQYAERFIDVQRDEFKRLGVLGLWEDPYLTMSLRYEATTAAEFAKFYFAGSVYRSKKPIYWCSQCRTALAEAEVEYADHTSPSIYVAFPLLDDLSAKYPDLGGLEVFLVIWTTTPWTIPANLAIALNPDFEYVAVRHGNKAYIMASRLAPLCMDTFGLSGWSVVSQIDPHDLEGIKARHPLYDRESVGVLADYVTLEAGTGLVHTAPGHGREDYETGQLYGIDTYSPVDDTGRFTAAVEHFAGLKVLEANEAVNQKLDQTGLLLASESITHSYPHCWRCKQPVIFRATPQWFISMDQNGLRAKALSAIRDQVRWVPAWGRERIYGMIESRPDWCISRQRSWGVPIIVFTCRRCDSAFLTPEIADKVVEIFAAEGADAWYARPAADFLPPGAACPDCGSAELDKEMDILDVWFDSGVSQAAVLAKRDYLTWPADMYLEGSDQHRGWFHSSLLCAVGTRQAAPYKMVLTHGFVVDGEGRKMSKSLGNVIAADKVIKQYGAEILRLWVAAEDYTDDIRLPQDILKQLAEAYRRIRNTMRFMLGNLADFDPARHQVPAGEMPEMERYILGRLQDLCGRLRSGYQDFAFHVVHHALHNFCVVDLSGFYLDVRKDVLYTFAADDPRRRAAQSAIYTLLDTMVRLMAPILSFTAEEVWDHLPGAAQRAPSVHLTLLPEIDQELKDPELERRWQKLREVRGEVNKALDLARKDKVVGNSLEASLRLAAPKQWAEFIARHQEVIKEITMVSELELTGQVPQPCFSSQELPGLKVAVAPSGHPRCARCWNRLPSVGQDQAHPELCHRCLPVVGGS